MESSPSTPSPLPRALAAAHRSLGIPPTYAADRKLVAYHDAPGRALVEIAINDEGRPILLLQPAADAWDDMQRAAARNDIELVPISGFRSIARQTEIIREKLAAGQRIDDILRYVAAPGFSEHHSGRAIDIGSPEHIELDEEFAHTTAYHWLEQHAASFGFSLSYPRNNPNGIGYEPWHWLWKND